MNIRPNPEKHVHNSQNNVRKRQAVTKTGDEGWRNTYAYISLQEQNTLNFKLLRTGGEVKNTECREGESVLTFYFLKN